MSQLTITLDDNFLQAAQAYAQQHGQELNALVAQLLAEAMQSAPTAPATPAPTIEQRLALVRALAGSVKVPADFDYKKELEEGLAERYGV